MFGPGDSFNPERTKLMGGIIRRVVEAKQSSSPSISCWGTGEVLRQVLYVKDAAKMILEAFMNYNDSSETLNITNPTEFTVAELVDLVVDVVGYEGEVQWDTTKPSGQARRWLSSNKMNQSVTHPVTDMRVAVTETVGWYLDNKAKADARL
jgi:nucleoside-diphosphate-sugar epimerase